MKKFDLSSQYANTPQISASNSTQKTSGFNITELLQLLPKLNLGGLFNNAKTQSQPPFPEGESFTPTQNLMRNQNLYEAKKKVDTHLATIQKIREENHKN